MHLSRTFSLYIGRKYLQFFGVSLASISGIVFLFDFVELLRRASNKEGVGVGLVFQMELAKLPNMIELVLPFAILFGAMFTFFKMTRTNELVIARAAGVSVWQFILPVMMYSFSIGLVVLTVFNPIASSLLSRFESLEARYLENSENQINIIENGVWLRQSVEGKQAVIHAQRFSQNDIVLNNVTIFSFEKDDAFRHRIDAASAKLEEGYWLLRDATLSDLTMKQRTFKAAKFPTNLTPEDILNSFAEPETLSFWELPSFINVLEKAGFSAVRHRLHLNMLITIPVLFCAMVLIAASFSLRQSRRGNTMVMVVGGLLAGFVLYFLNDVISALGMSAKIPVLLAAWTPPTIAVLFGTTFLLHSEDG